MKTLIFTLFLSLICGFGFSQKREVFRIDSLPKQGILLDKGWKWHTGDNPDFAKADFNDLAWKGIDPTKDIVYLKHIDTKNPLWIRLKIKTLSPKTIILNIKQSSASEVFLNGKHIKSFGKIGNKNITTRAYSPVNELVAIHLDTTENTLAVRHFFQTGIRYNQFADISYPLFSCQIITTTIWKRDIFWEGFNIGVPFILFLVYFTIFLFYIPNKATLWFSLWGLSDSLTALCRFLSKNTPEILFQNQYTLCSSFFSTFSLISLFCSIFLLLGQKKIIYLIIFAGLVVSGAVSYFLGSGDTPAIINTLITFLSAVSVIVMGISSMNKGHIGGKYVIVGITFYGIFWTIFLFFFTGDNLNTLASDIVFHISTLSLPVTVATLLGTELRNTNLSLLKNLDRVQSLATEKQQILTTQNETLERQVAERTSELEHKNRDLEIEAALERIRSRAMSMRTSEEINGLIGHVFAECTKLDMPLARCTIMTYEKATYDVTWWMANAEDPNNPMNCFVKHYELSPIMAFLRAWQNREQRWVYLLEGEEKKVWNQYMFEQSGLSQLPEAVKRSMRSSQKIILNACFMDFGGITFSSFEPFSHEHFDILVRVTNVFDQTYTRYLDLQKAEKQVREAQIEAALERVRSRTMSMSSSTELREVVATIYDQLQHLGFTNGALGIVIMDSPSGDMDWWMAGFGKENYPENYYIPYFDHPFYLAQLNAWKQGQKYVTIEVSGQSKKAYDEVIFSKTGFVRIPLETQKIMSNFEQITFSNANMKYGALSWGIEPLDNGHAQILQRFAIVFEQTYTRFLDLQKKEEQAVKLAEEKQKLEKTLSELRSTQAQLIQKEKLASLGELTAGIAHEIQNPLNFVNNFSELSVELIEEIKVERSKVKEERDEALENELLSDLAQNQEKINLHGKRASNIVKGMLEHSRTSTGVKELTDINQLVDEYLRLSYHGLRAKDTNFNCELLTEFDPNFPQIEVIPQDIGRVLLNLINNAFWAVKTVEKPKVVVKTEQIENKIMITVKDNGIGMSEQIKAKIFQPFFTTKPTGEGTGLGLSLAYDIVTKGHGGTIEVESMEGEGTMFTVKLPILT